MTKKKRFHPIVVLPALLALTLYATLFTGCIHAAEPDEIGDPASPGRTWSPENSDASPALSTSARVIHSEERALVAEGKASYYASNFHGKKTASGEVFNLNRFTAAHRTLPFGTNVKIINLNNGKNVLVRINDRGPHLRGRIIDVSPAAAKEIGLFGKGTATVRIEAYN